MIRILLLFAFTLSAWDYLAPSYYSMIDQSDLIIHSQIIGQNDSTIQVKIFETLKGESDFNKITIRKFQNWTCARRYDDYLLCQEQIFILKYNRDDKFYHVISAGNQGEMPIVSDSIFLKSLYTQKDKFVGNLNKRQFLKCDLASSLEGMRRLITMVREYPSTDINCNLLSLAHHSDLENVIVEEHLKRGGFKDKCEAYGAYDFKVLNVN